MDQERPIEDGSRRTGWFESPKASTSDPHFEPRRMKSSSPDSQTSLSRMVKIQSFRSGQRGQNVFLITALRIPDTPDRSIRLRGEKRGLSSGKELASKGRRVVSREENTRKEIFLKTFYKLSENCDDRTKFVGDEAVPIANPHPRDPQWYGHVSREPVLD